MNQNIQKSNQDNNNFNNVKNTFSNANTQFGENKPKSQTANPVWDFDFGVSSSSNMNKTNDPQQINNYSDFQFFDGNNFQQNRSIPGKNTNSKFIYLKLILC
jgi:hypothetical protein